MAGDQFAVLAGNSRLGRVLAPALDKVIKNTSWRKHGKLVQDCKLVLDRLAVVPEDGAAAANGPPSDKTTEESGEKIIATAGAGVDSPLFDGNLPFSPADAEMILQPLFSACDTLSVKVAEPALDCFQKLIAHGHLRGEMDAGEGVESKLLLQVMDSVCRCYDLGDESIELLVLKTLLSAVTSTSLRVHGDSLLKAVRTCYNIYLGSKVPVNQTTAKASLTQMLVIVFRRMEADSSTVPVQPIVVADLMEPAERSNSDTNVVQFVQGFITKVVQEIEVVLTPSPSLRSQRHDGAFDAKASDGTSPTDILESTDRDMLDAKYWEINMFKRAVEERKGELVDGDLDKEGDLEVLITNKLRRDAFLVFRALCKLSMKSPPQDGTADQYSMRGKIIALELLKILLENAGAIFRTSERYAVRHIQGPVVNIAFMRPCIERWFSPHMRDVWRDQRWEPCQTDCVVILQIPRGYQAVSVLVFAEKQCIVANERLPALVFHIHESGVSVQSWFEGGDRSVFPHDSLTSLRKCGTPKLPPEDDCLTFLGEAFCGSTDIGGHICELRL